MHAWEDVIDEETAEVYRRYKGNEPLAGRTALICIDNYNAVFGDQPQPILAALERFPSSCGLVAWAAIEPTKRLMRAAREAGVPVLHTTKDGEGVARTGRSATRRSERGGEESWSYQHMRELAPRSNEVVIRKRAASAFFETELADILRRSGVETTVLCGNSTSGCVRATAVDGFSLGFNVTVVEECVFDRSPLSHKVNLFDLNAKYARVRFLPEVLAHLKRCGNLSGEVTTVSA